MTSQADEQPQAIRLNESDMRIGVLLEIEAARAQARLQAIVDVAEIIRAQMAIKYEVGDDHQMQDWIAGFKPVTPE